MLYFYIFILFGEVSHNATSELKWALDFVEVAHAMVRKTLYWNQETFSSHLQAVQPSDKSQKPFGALVPFNLWTSLTRLHFKSILPLWDCFSDIWMSCTKRLPEWI